jgi:alpha-tubulin suppressor-like RCC1 family protein
VTERNELKIVHMDLPIAEISAGNGFSVALAQNGSVYTFGRNDRGQLGINSNAANSSIPVLIPQEYFRRNEDARGVLPARIQHITSGANFTVVLTERGKMLSWGADGKIELSFSSYF